MRGMGILLDRLEGPEDLADLSFDELTGLAGELREFIITTVSRNGGHLAANLGVVELTIALLRVFSPPRDPLVWDTAHQSYAYKILTDRKKSFHTLRQFGGISGFLKRGESPYDVFGAGHAGTALSAALGLAAARDRRGGNEHVVAIVGDAAAGCGISLEALNNLGETTRRLIVVLNDNEMSISENVGAISRYLGGLLSNPRYNRWKRSVETVASHMHMGWMRSAYYRMEEAVKGLFLKSVLFEEFGLRYVGPIDGHNFGKLIDALEMAKTSDRPIILHVSTLKGKGYTFAEDQPTKWHGTPSFDVVSGESAPKGTKSYSDIFGDVLCRLAREDERICAITAGMCVGTGLTSFALEFPNRFFDVGISEEHAAVFAAGLAAADMKPVYAVYSTFSQRAVDCVLHDIALQKLPVVLCLDRAGVVGDDGPTHHGVMDIVLFRSVPGLILMQPKDEAELARMLRTALDSGRPTIIRYPRGGGSGATVPDPLDPLEVGKAEELTPPGAVSIWALGDMVPLALQAAEILADDGIATGVVNARFVTPLDAGLLDQQAATVQLLVTLENGVVDGGFGSAVLEHLNRAGSTVRVLRLGWPHAFVPQGTPAELRESCGLTPAKVADGVRALLAKSGS